MALFGIKISTGTISTMEARASAARVPAVAEAHGDANNAEVKPTDAIRWLLAGIAKGGSAPQLSKHLDPRRQLVNGWTGTGAQAHGTSGVLDSTNARSVSSHSGVAVRIPSGARAGSFTQRPSAFTRSVIADSKAASLTTRPDADR